MPSKYNTGDSNLDGSLELLDESAQRITRELAHALSAQMVPIAQSIGRNDNERTARIGREGVQQLLAQVKAAAETLRTNGAQIGLQEGRWVHRRPLSEIAEWATRHHKPESLCTAEYGYRALVHKAAEDIAEILRSRGYETRSDTSSFNTSKFPDLVVKEFVVPAGVKAVALEYEQLFFRVGAEVIKFLKNQTAQEKAVVDDYWTDVGSDESAGPRTPVRL